MSTNRECCKIDAIVTIDSKGQIVLPKDLRDRANLKPGDKLAIIAFERGDTVGCFAMVKTEMLGGSVKKTLGPVLKEALQ